MRLAQRQVPFDSPDYRFELKWDGFRSLAIVRPGQPIILRSKRGMDFAPRFPELQTIADRRRRMIVLDGEICVLNNGYPDFPALLDRFNGRGDAQVTYVAFDILCYADDHWLLDVPLHARQRILRRFFPISTNLVTRSIPILGAGIDLFCKVEAHGIEGIVAKSSSSFYKFGVRSDDWIKIKTRAAIEGQRWRAEVFNGRKPKPADI